MGLYAISDLHLSFSTNKPMNVFGNMWEGYEDKIKENWLNTVNENDYVIINGDISWGMHLSQAKKDFEFLHMLPGHKIILKGNHDYYFNSKNKMELFFKDNKMDEFIVLQNNIVEYENYIICGTRGWGEVENSILDEKLIKREALRIRMNLDLAMQKKMEDPSKKIIFVMHFPPFLKEFKDVIDKYDIDTCIYGHLHGYGHSKIKEGIIDNINYKMVSCDYTGFKLVKI